MSVPSEAPTKPRSAGRTWLLLGLALAVLGVLAYVAQVGAMRLTMPWYLPVTGTLAAALIIVSIRQARSVWRVLALVLVLLLAGMEWMFVFSTRLPAYTGPLAVGQPFPEFATRRADGTPFTERDLVGRQRDVLVFFRGRW